MKILKLSEFLQRKDTKPFLLGAFYSRIISINDDQYFATTSSFKKSDYVYDVDFDYESYKDEYLDKLNYFSGHQGWFKKIAEKNLSNLNLPHADYIFLIENDLKLTASSFFKTLLSKIYSCDWAMEDDFNEDKKFFIRGYMELRGSIDTNRAYITQDYFYNSQKEISKAKLLFDFLNLPTSIGNINFRELQEQYVSEIKKRNTQFRLGLNWYAQNIGFINKYKAKIFENCYHYKNKYIDLNNITFYVCPQRDPRDTNTFMRYINYFSNNVTGKKLTKSEIEVIRNKLGFTNGTTPSNNRNKKIIDIFRELSEDKCAICDTTKTYTNSKTGRQHFEIHHMISFKNGKELDVYDNLVKLCPNCHDMMKKSSGIVTDQINAIIKILNENTTIYEFCSSFLNIDDINELASKIQTMLG